MSSNVKCPVDTPCVHLNIQRIFLAFIGDLAFICTSGELPSTTTTSAAAAAAIYMRTATTTTTPLSIYLGCRVYLYK